MSDAHSPDNLSRRSMLKVGAAGCATTILATSVAANPLIAKPSPFRQWQSAINQDIHLLEKPYVDDAAFQPVRLQLVEVVQEKVKSQTEQALPGDLSEHSISLRFETPKRTQLESATYTISHAGLGEQNLFISEVLGHPDSKVRSFEAIIC